MAERRIVRSMTRLGHTGGWASHSRLVVGSLRTTFWSAVPGSDQVGYYDTCARGRSATMTPEAEPLDTWLDDEEPVVAVAAEEAPIVVDLDEAVFAVLRHVETTTDPSRWIRAAVQEKAEREGGTRRDAPSRLSDLLAETLRIVELEREFAGVEALGPLGELTAHLRDAQALVKTLGPLLADG